MKKIAFYLSLFALVNLQAGIVGNTFDAAGDLTESALEVPGTIVHGRSDDGREHHLFRRSFRRYNDSNVQ